MLARSRQEGKKEYSRHDTTAKTKALSRKEHEISKKLIIVRRWQVVLTIKAGKVARA